MKINNLIRLTLLLTITFSGCNSVKKVAFKTPVDTTTKKINNQLKKTYYINDLDVYASNQFDAARLNGFEKVNDSTVKAFIRPENSPINNSAYYSFKIWSNNSKSIYIQFDYPEGYQHRYIPKIKHTNSNWYPLDTNNVYKHNNIVSVKLNISKDTTWVSAQETVTSKDTEKWYKNAISNKPFVHLKSAGKSTLGKKFTCIRHI